MTLLALQAIAPTRITELGPGVGAQEAPQDAEEMQTSSADEGAGPTDADGRAIVPVNPAIASRGPHDPAAGTWPIRMIFVEEYREKDSGRLLDRATWGFVGESWSSWTRVLLDTRDEDGPTGQGNIGNTLHIDGPRYRNGIISSPASGLEGLDALTELVRNFPANAEPGAGMAGERPNVMEAATRGMHPSLAELVPNAAEQVPNDASVTEEQYELGYPLEFETAVLDIDEAPVEAQPLAEHLGLALEDLTHVSALQQEGGCPPAGCPIDVLYHNESRVPLAVEIDEGERTFSYRVEEISIG